MPLNSERTRKRIEKLRQRRAKAYSGQDFRRVYVMIDDAPVEITNKEGEPPFIKESSLNKQISLAVLTSIKKNFSVYQIEIITDDPENPSLSFNQRWMLTLDGINLFVIEGIHKELRSGNCYWYYFQGQPGAGAISVPIIDPSVSLSLTGASTRAYGDASDLIFNWSVTRGSFDISAITLTDTTIAPITGQTQSNTATFTPTITDEDVTYILRAEDVNENFAQTSRTVTRQLEYYWGRWVEPTLNAEITADEINALDGAGFGDGREFFNGTLNRTFTGMDGQNQYFVWAFPSDETVVFYDGVFGLVITDMVKIADGVFLNSFGYPQSLQVWRTNFLQGGVSTPIRVQVG